MAVLTIISGAILIVGSAALMRSQSLIITLTDSSCPIGIYRLVSKSFARGDLVEACLPDPIADYGIARNYLAPGDCPNGAEPVVKLVGATEGDRVDLSADQIRVNGFPLPNSATLPTDNRGRPAQSVARGTHATRSNQVWLFGLHDPRSWDSRYFGPVPISAVRGSLQPVFTLDSSARSE